MITKFEVGKYYKNNVDGERIHVFDRYDDCPVGPTLFVKSDQPGRLTLRSEPNNHDSLGVWTEIGLDEWQRQLN